MAVDLILKHLKDILRLSLYVKQKQRHFNTFFFLLTLHRYGHPFVWQVSPSVISIRLPC